jgi:hypothetical protein
MKHIRIATIGSPEDYRQGLLPIIAQSLGYQLDWVRPKESDLLIFGPFADPNPKIMGWCPKPLRPALQPLQERLLITLSSRRTPPVTLFHTAENLRHDFIGTNYAISFDLNIQANTHFRLPYWMEILNWSHEGITGNQNPRYGRLLSIDRLTRPLGKGFLEKSREVAFLSSHLREPRKTLLNAVNTVLPVTGFGPYFDSRIKNHHLSGFLKCDVLQDFAFNLCPENGMYPGYYTEKIPEAFFADCLPIAWADESVRVDFNPEALINLAPMTWCNFEPLKELLGSPRSLDKFATQPLLLQVPSILPFRDYVKRICEDAIS